MRRLFTTADAHASGITKSALQYGQIAGRWRSIVKGVYGDGPGDPSPLDVARARVIASGGVAAGRLAGVLYGLDSVDLRTDRRRQRARPEAATTIHGVPVASGLQTLVDLAAELGDDTWEQALESALRRRLTTLPELEGTLPDLARARTPGTARMRLVLARRLPHGAPPTESLLETLMVQLARTVEGLPDPTRQHVVLDRHGLFVARVDLCWPDLGLFVELDGQQHRNQPLYDARRETAVVAATGWLASRFTWHEVRRVPRATARRLGDLAAQARRRPAA